MINGEHEKLDFHYVVDGEVFSKLFCLVNGIYPFLSHIILSEPDPHTKIVYGFAADQEAHRKDIERGFGVLKIKFLALMTLSIYIIMTQFITWYWVLFYNIT